MSETAINLNMLLREIEHELQQIDLWTEKQPDPQAFTSTVPFCHDSMTFNEWVQWVMIPTFDEILAKGGTLPATGEITPLAKKALGEIPDRTEQLLQLIQQLDELINSRAASLL